MIGELGSQMIVWFEDQLMYAKSENHFIEELEKIFRKCQEYNLNLQPEKHQHFSTSILLCGRVIFEDVVRFDPRREQGIIILSSCTISMCIMGISPSVYIMIQTSFFLITFGAISVPAINFYHLGQNLV